MKSLLAWVDSRTGVRALLRAMLYEHIPGGARWRYVWGSTLVFAFGVQMVTGLFLWMAYSPSSQTAWESVYYIQHVMEGGWLLRGIHHYTAQIMVVLVALHVMQVVIDGAYRAPREFNFWIGLFLLQIVLGLGLTGYLLPWDQKGYWATKVATNIVGLVPSIGDDLKRLIVGGPEYGHHTLTRFFALHAGLLPFLMIVFTALHVYLFRRHGIRARRPERRPDGWFWPDQFLKDGVACLAVLAVVLFLVFRHSLFGGADAPPGAPLAAPAEPSEPYAAARPDWYFLFLYEFLKLPWFEGENEVWGAIYVPGMVMGVLFLMPLIGRWKLGHGFNVAVTFAILIGAGLLTARALHTDANDPDYQRAVAAAEANAARVLELASGPRGIPPAGAAALLRQDPLTEGPKLFARHCAGCHRHDGHDGVGGVPAEEPTASDLAGFASRGWLEGLFDPEQVDTHRYFGGTAFADGAMVDFVKETEDFGEEERAMLAAAIAALSAEAGLRSQRELDASERDAIERGRGVITGKGDDGLNCVKCHRFHGEGKDRGPELTGYGSRAWVLGLLHDPSHERYYGRRNDRMPAFGRKGILDARSLGLIADWLRGDWFVPGEPWEPPAARDSAAGAPSAAPVESAPRTDPAAGGATEAAPAEPSPSTDAPAPPNSEAADEDRSAAAPPRVPPGPIDFAGDVKPILEAHCHRCHGGGKGRPKGRYRMTTRELALAGGDYTERPIVPGNRAESDLYLFITSADPDERMPPADEAPPLTREQTEAIGRWIDAGAPWPEGLALDPAEPVEAVEQPK